MYPAWVIEGFEKRLTRPGGVSRVPFWLCRGDHGEHQDYERDLGIEIPTRTILNVECSLSLVG